MASIDQLLASLNIILPTPPLAVANYVPYVIEGNRVIISGQLPVNDGQVTFKGKIGHEVSLEEGQMAARLCAINILTQLKVACEGDLGRVQRCLRLGGFVNCNPDFVDHAKVINGASDLMVEVFGENGRHARAAIGVSSLPLGAAVEVEATFLING
jgi:enamine deaminase RidA (YjgF/YER057c/UK114 family)